MKNRGRVLQNLPYFIIIVCFWLFGICVTDSNDLANYRFAYERKISHGKEPLFDAVSFFFHDSGWSFDQFRILWVTLVVILLYFGIKRYSKNPKAVAGLAVVTVLTGFVVQMRSALVGAVFLNVFPLLLTGKKRDRLIYLLIILLCSQIHIIAYAFLLFLFINAIESKVFRRVYFVLIALVTLVALFGSTLSSSIIYSMLNSLPFGKNLVLRVISYFRGEDIHFRYSVFLIAKHLLLYYLTDRACEMQINKSTSGIFSVSQIRMIREANTLMLMFLPITILSASFERLFNCFVLIQYGMVFNVGKSKFRISKKKTWSINMQPVLVIGVLLITFVEWYFSPDDIVRILNSLEFVI